MGEIIRLSKIERGQALPLLRYKLELTVSDIARANQIIGVLRFLNKFLNTGRYRELLTTFIEISNETFGEWGAFFVDDADAKGMEIYFIYKD